MNKVELEIYLSRPESEYLTAHMKRVLRRYVRWFNKGYPIGRRLALGLMKLNSRCDSGSELVSQKFINWLYYY